MSPINLASGAEGAVHVTVRIGVTGHRELPDERPVRRSVKKVLSLLDELLSQTPHTYVAVSPLAEGADRIVAKEVLDWQSDFTQASSLECPLPMPAEEYIRDFRTDESKVEFNELLARASRSEELDPRLKEFETNTGDPQETENLKKENRRRAYRHAGLHVVETCNVLIAIWDGETAKGPGGTAEIVRYAREKMGRTLFWINSKNGKITEERSDDGALESLERLDSYNAEHVNVDKVEAEIQRRYSKLEQQATLAGLSPAIVEPFRKTLLPQFVRATLLARLYQNRHMWAGTAVYLIAAAAVATVTLLTLFWPGHPEWFWLEVVEIGLILIVLVVSDLGDWLRKWIDYRFLAERLRAAFFLSVAGLECEPSKPPEYLSLSHRPDEWMVTAFSRICSASPAAAPGTSDFAPLKRFLLNAWLDDQEKFYRTRSRELYRTHKTLEFMGFSLFALTLVAAVFHASGLGHKPVGTISLLPGIYSACAIILPAVGASLSGIRVYREYLRNSKRYGSMAKHLSRIREQVQNAGDTKNLLTLVAQANLIMLREHQDWRVVVLFHETPAAI